METPLGAAALLDDGPCGCGRGRVAWGSPRLGITAWSQGEVRHRLAVGLPAVTPFTSLQVTASNGKFRRRWGRREALLNGHSLGGASSPEFPWALLFILLLALLGCKVAGSIKN